MKINALRPAQRSFLEAQRATCSCHRHEPIFHDRFDSGIDLPGGNHESLRFSTESTPSDILGQIAGQSKSSSAKQSQAVSGYPRHQLDTTTRPQDDFYRFAVGGYEDSVEIPGDRSRYGIRSEVYERVQTELLGILDKASKASNPEGSIDQKIGDFYASGLDTKAIDAKGAQPIQGMLNEIDGISNLEQFQGVLTGLHFKGIGALFSFGGGADLHNPNMQVAWADQGGLGLPNESYYNKTDERSQEIRDKYVDHMATMFGKIGESPEQARASAEAVMAIESRLAKTHQTRLERRNPDSYDNKISRQELLDSQKNFSWERYLNDSGLSEEKEIYHVNPSFFSEVDKALGEVSVDDWKAFLKWNVVRSSASYLSSDFENERFNFFSKELHGVEKKSPRWRKMVSLSDSYLGEAVGQKFVEKNFTPKAKERALNMVDNVLDVMRERISNRDWMGPETKKEALAKLDTMGVKIGYPDKWEDFSDFPIDRNDFFGNIMTGKARSVSQDLKSIGQPVDKSKWSMTPSTVNAYYSPLKNEIAFPAARLMPPFFDVNADDASNYGSTGVTVAHELTHGFDDSGSRYDSTGRKRNWWQPEDLKNFKEIAGAVADHMDTFSFDGVQNNGKQTTGEALADLGGVELAYEALQRALADQPPVESTDGFTNEQRFFLAYAVARQGKNRPKAAKQQIQNGVHPLPSFRVHGAVTNFDPFYQAFDIKPGDDMYRNPEDRIKLWD